MDGRARRSGCLVDFRWAAWGYAFLFALSGFAFYPKYFSRAPRDVDLYTHAHAAVAVLWVGLLVAQPLLARRNLALHRRLGRFSYFLAPAFVVAALLLAHQRFRAMDEKTFRQEAPSLFLPLSAVVLFTVSYALALVHRRHTPLHARFMVLTGLPMIDPVLGRTMFFYLPELPHPLVYQAVTFGLTNAIVVALLFLPAPSRTFRFRYAVPAALFPGLHVLWFTFAQSPAWVPIAAWFRALPLTG